MSVHMPPQDFPITGLCIVANPDKCPPGYELLYKSYDRKEDCDLWKDSWLKAKITRYLCVTRVYPLNQGQLNNVLGDITLIPERENAPPGFTSIEDTIDTSEKATRKKQICVKMLPRSSCSDAISELIILSRSKRPPSGYTLIGEMNGLMLCFKMNRVPPETQQQTTTSTQNEPTSVPPTIPYTPPVPVTAERQHSSDIASTSRHNGLTRQESVLLPSNPLAGVPFHLNPRFQASQYLQNMNGPSVNCKTRYAIDAEYSYPFRLENQVLQSNFSTS